MQLECQDLVCPTVAAEEPLSLGEEVSGDQGDVRGGAVRAQGTSLDWG